MAAKRKSIRIIYHSQSGRSEQLAFAFYQGALKNNEVAADILRAEEASLEHLLEVDAWVFCCAENFAEIAGGMKNFFDRVYYPFERAAKAQAMPYMLVLSAGNDGSFCEKKLTRILTGMSAKKVQETVVVHGRPSESDLKNIEDYGEAFATAIELGAF